jgi:hypothetical protein
MNILVVMNMLAASASAFHSVSPLENARAITASRCVPAALMSLPDDPKVRKKVAELRASWQRSYGDSGEPDPTEEKLISMAEEIIAGEAAGAERLLALEAELAADDAKADAYWNAPENVAAREAKAARKAAEKAAANEHQ